MIVNQIHQEFKLGCDKVDSLNSANFLPEEIDKYLSDAQEEFIEQRAWGNNFRRESIEETQKRVKDLQDITVNAELTVFTSNLNNKPNSKFVKLPSDYRHALEEEVTVQYPDCNHPAQGKGALPSTRVPVLALTHDKYNKTIQNPFTKPSLTKAYRLPYARTNTGEQQFELIVSPDQTLITYHLRYLKNPRKIDKAQILSPLGLPGTAQGDMTDETYREIIQIAIKNCLIDITSERAQSRTQRVQEVE